MKSVKSIIGDYLKPHPDITIASFVENGRSVTDASKNNLFGLGLPVNRLLSEKSFFSNQKRSSKMVVSSFRRAISSAKSMSGNKRLVLRTESKTARGSVIRREVGVTYEDTVKISDTLVLRSLFEQTRNRAAGPTMYGLMSDSPGVTLKSPGEKIINYSVVLRASRRDELRAQKTLSAAYGVAVSKMSASPTSSFEKALSKWHDKSRRVRYQIRNPFSRNVRRPARPLKKKKRRKRI